MKHKNWILFSFLLILLFLSGCDANDYNKSFFKPDQANCWPCKLYIQAFEAISLAMSKGLPVVCDNCLDVLKLLLPIWLTIKILPWIYSFNPPNFGKDIKEIIVVLFKTLIVALLLSVKTSGGVSGNATIDFGGTPVQVQFDYSVISSNQNRAIYDVAGKMFLQPLGDIFINISQMALAAPSQVGISISNYGDAGGFGSSFLKDLWSKIDQASGGILNKATDIMEQFENAYTLHQISEDPMLGKLPMRVQSIIFALYQALWSGMGLAFQLFISKTFMGFVSGVVLFCGLFYMVLILPISFVEAILTMGLTIILLPAYLLFWIFPSKAKGILKKIFNNLFSAFFDILFNCIYVAFLVSVIRLYLKANSDVSYLFSSDFQTQESGLRLSASNLNTSFLIMTILVWTILKLFKNVGEFSSYFFDGAGKGSGIVKFMDRLKSMGKHLALSGAMALTGNWAGAAKNLKSVVSEDMKGMMDDGRKEMK